MDFDHDTLVAFSKSWGLIYIAKASSSASTSSTPSGLPNRKVSTGPDQHPRPGRQAMEVNERDPATGAGQLGTVERHQELDTPVPRGLMLIADAHLGDRLVVSIVPA